MSRAYAQARRRALHAAHSLRGRGDRVADRLVTRRGTALVRGAIKLTPQTNTSPLASHAIGELCIEADWAWSTSDFRTLRRIAEELAIHYPEPVHCELRELAEACVADGQRATARWPVLRDRLLGMGGP